MASQRAATAARLNCSVHRALAASPIRCRSSGSATNLDVAATIADRSSTGTTRPVSSSFTIDVTPGTEVATTGRPLMPASMSTPGHALTGGPAAEDHHVGAPHLFGDVVARPAQRDPGRLRRPGHRVAQGAVADELRPQRRALCPEPCHHLDEPIRSLAGRQCPDEEHERRVGGAPPARRMEDLGIASVRSQRHPGRRYSEPGQAFVEDLFALCGHRVGLRRQPSPQLELDPAIGTGVGADRIVEQWTVVPDHGRHRVLQRLAAVGHDDGRIETLQRGTEPAHQPECESDARCAPVAMPEGEIGSHLRRPLEETEHAMETEARRVELVGQGPGLELGAAGQGGRNDVQHEGQGWPVSSLR